MPRAEILGERIGLETEYRDKDLVRSIPGSKFDGATRAWSVPLTWASCRALRGLFRERLTIGPDLLAWAGPQAEHVSDILGKREQALDVDADSEGDERLRTYQRTFVTYGQTADGLVILADDMGTGKTPQSIAMLERLDAYPALIVTPKTVKGTWVREFEHWAPHRSVINVTGSASKRRKLLAEEADVHVVHWDILKEHSRLAPYGSVRLTEKDKTPKELNAMRFAAVIADEAHRAKDPKAQRTRALWAVAHGSSPDGVRIALTGTPVANNPSDFWSLLHFINPVEWPSRTKFIDRYCVTAWNAFGGVDVIGIKPDVREEFFGIVDRYFLRRTKEMVLKHLPPIVRHRLDIEMAPKQARAYKGMAEGMLAKLDSGTIVATDSLTQRLRKEQLASAYLEVEGEEVRLCEPSSKLDALIDLLQNDIPQDESVVVFAKSRQLIDLADARLAKAGITHGRITGSETDGERDWAIRNFQAGSFRVVLCTYAAASEGITLTRGNHLVRLQRTDNAVEDKQAHDRVHRIGSEIHDVINVWDFVGIDTVDVDVIENLDGKGAIAQQITRDNETKRRLEECA